MKKNNHNLGVIEGKYVNLREVTVEDAEFILKLRTSPRAQRLLHHTDPDIERQRLYLRNYLTLEYEWYFIVTDKAGLPIGCLSVYDVKGDSVCTGRWLMEELENPSCGIEGDLLLKEFAFNNLGASEIRMDTRLENLTMRSFFKIWGCEITNVDQEEVYVVLSKAKYNARLPFVRRFCK